MSIFVFASRTVGASQRGLYTAAILEPHTHRDREFASRAACVASEHCDRLRVSTRSTLLHARTCVFARLCRALQSVVLARDSAVRHIALASQYGRHVGAGMQGVRDLPSGTTVVSLLHHARTPHNRSLALQPMASGLAPTMQTTSAPSRMCSAGAISRFAQYTRLISLSFSDDVQSRAVKQRWVAAHAVRLPTLAVAHSASRAVVLCARRAALRSSLLFGASLALRRGSSELACNPQKRGGGRNSGLRGNGNHMHCGDRSCNWLLNWETTCTKGISDEL
ncbi:hypothetical protein DFH09DRAFT_1108007 [Mycena vulgaris]|nr:hypothetical protein DFH09DRAFT_1108007 [Mycena vulgaris]